MRLGAFSGILKVLNNEECARRALIDVSGISDLYQRPVRRSVRSETGVTGRALRSCQARREKQCILEHPKYLFLTRTWHQHQQYGFMSVSTVDGVAVSFRFAVWIHGLLVCLRIWSFISLV